MLLISVEEVRVFNSVGPDFTTKTICHYLTDMNAIRFVKYMCDYHKDLRKGDKLALTGAWFNIINTQEVVEKEEVFLKDIRNSPHLTFCEVYLKDVIDAEKNKDVINIQPVS